MTLVRVDKPGEKRFYVLCRETRLSAPRLLRAWSRRSGIEHTFRTLKHWWATAAGQAQTEDASDGHLVLRVVAGLVLFYTAHRLFKGRVTREEIVFSLKHHGRVLTSESVE